MIFTTLNKIRDHSPCSCGWTKLLAHLGKSSADDEPLALSVVLDNNGLDDTLWCLRSVPEHNKLWRRYAIWCARQVQHLMTDPRSLAALDVAEYHANGTATDQELAAAWAAAGDAAGADAWAAAWAAARAAEGDAAGDAAWAAARAAAWAAARAAARDVAGADAWAAARDAAWAAARDAAGAAAWAAAWDAAWAAARDAQTKRLRELLETTPSKITEVEQ